MIPPFRIGKIFQYKIISTKCDFTYQYNLLTVFCFGLLFSHLFHRLRTATGEHNSKYHPNNSSWECYFCRNRVFTHYNTLYSHVR